MTINNSHVQDEYHLARTVMLMVLCISSVSIFIAYTTSTDVGLTCTPTHQTAACNFNQIQDSINTSTTNLVNSFNNVTTTPLTPVNNSAALGFGVVFNVFITIPNAFAHLFGWWNTNINPATNAAYGASGFLLSLLAIVFQLIYFVLFTLFVFIPAILGSLSIGVFAPLLALLEIAATGIFIVLGIVLIVNRIQNR